MDNNVIENGFSIHLMKDPFIVLFFNCMGAKERIPLFLMVFTNGKKSERIDEHENS